MILSAIVTVDFEASELNLKGNIAQIVGKLLRIVSFFF